MTATGYQNYRQVQATTADSGELIVMLYEGAVGFLARARLALHAGDLPAAHGYIVRAQDIVVELRAGLNQASSPVGNELAALYDYIYRRLVAANVSKSSESVEEVSALLQQLLAAWRQAAELYRRENNRTVATRMAVSLAVGA